MKLNTYLDKASAPAIKYQFLDIDYSQPEVNNLPSETIPDESLTVQEIMTRFARNMPINASNREPIYHGDQFVPDFEHMDLADREQYLDETKKEVENIKKIINTTGKAKDELKKPKPEELQIISETKNTPPITT